MDLLLPDDLDLFRQIAAGDKQAELCFRRIFHLYNAKLYPFVLKVTRSKSATEDIIQEAFLRLWLHRGEVAEMNNPSSWLYRVVSNLSFTYLRSQAAEIRRLQHIGSLRNAMQDDVIEDMSGREIRVLLSKAVDQLPPKRRHIYILSRDQGLSHKEIAELLDISPNTVKNQLVNALKFIKDYLHQNDIVIPLLILVLLH